MRKAREFGIFVNGRVDGCPGASAIDTFSLSFRFTFPPLEHEIDVAEALVYRFVTASQVFITGRFDVVEDEWTLGRLQCC